jgi:AcrR family transcriptional regulator
VNHGKELLVTRDDILQAAAAIFSQKGFHAASMQDIADAVSLQKASLYHHFPSKQDILIELLNHALEIIITRLEEVTSQSIPPEQRLRQAMIAYMQILAEYQELSIVLLLEYRSLDNDLRASHIPRRDRFERLWRDLVEEGTRTGAFNCAEPSLAGRALLGVMNWTVTWFRKEGASSIEAIASQFTELFLRGLLIRNETGLNQHD